MKSNIVFCLLSLDRLDHRLGFYAERGASWGIPDVGGCSRSLGHRFHRRVGCPRVSAEDAFGILKNYISGFILGDRIIY